VAEVAAAPALGMLAVTLWLFQKPKRRLNWQNRRERLLASNSPCLGLALTAIQVPAETPVHKRAINLKLAAAAEVLMAAVRVWLLDAAAATQLVVAATFSFQDPKLRMTPITMLRRPREPKVRQGLRRISSVAGAKATEGLDLETLMVTGGSPPLNNNHNNNLHKITTKLRIWAISTCTRQPMPLLSSLAIALVAQ
jgi:hypothetical protein